MEAAAGVGHHVALSVVGTDRLLASGYFRAKMAQENLIKASPIPYTIVRATQFYEFVGGIVQSATEGQTVRVPPVMMQPIVAYYVAAVSGRCGSGSTVERHVRAGRSRIGSARRPRAAIPESNQGRTDGNHASAVYYGIAVNDKSLTPGENPRLGTIRFADWLRRSVPDG